MQNDETTQQPATLASMIEALGTRNGVVAATHKALTDAGYKCTVRTIYQTIERNGTNNPTIALALAEAIQAARNTRQQLAARLAALGQQTPPPDAKPPLLPTPLELLIDEATKPPKKTK